MPTIQTLSEHLRAYRLSRGLTQEHLAHQLGLCTATISRLERGCYKRGPSPMLREKLVKILKEKPT